MKHKRCCNLSARITEVNICFYAFNVLIPSKAIEQREAHCRAAMVCMIGMRMFKRCAMMTSIGKDVVLMIARMMWDACVDGAWVVQNE